MKTPLLIVALAGLPLLGCGAEAMTEEPKEATPSTTPGAAAMTTVDLALGRNI